MKTIFFGIFLFGIGQLAYAGNPPIGKFDCSLKKGRYHLEISQPSGTFYYVKVEHVIESEESYIEGPLLVAQQKSSSGKSFQRLRLPGSNLEFYFDDEGRIGLSREYLNCKRM